MRLPSFTFTQYALYRLSILLCCTGLLSLGSIDVLSDSAADQQKRFEQVKKDITRIKHELATTKTKRGKLLAKLEQNEIAIREVAKKLLNITHNVANNQERLKKLYQEQSTLKVNKQREALAIEQDLTMAYRLGNQSEIRLLLNQQNPTQVARMMTYFKAVNSQRAHRLNAFLTMLKDLEQVQKDINNRTEQLKHARVALNKEKQVLTQAQKERSKTLKSLDQDLSTQNQVLSSLKADEQRLQKLLDSVYKHISEQELNLSIGKFTQQKGKLLWPTASKAANKFGQRRKNSNLRWQGLEFNAKRGADVQAIYHGQVVFSDYLRGHGLLIIIDHGNGYMSLYAHNDNLYKALGEWVTIGEKIADVGDTGGKRNPTLYFELRHNGKATNPIPWLRRK